MKTLFYTGGYADADEPGLCLYSFDPKAGFERQWARCGLHNPSYIVAHPTLPLLYTVEEDAPEGRVCAWSVAQNPPGRVASVPSDGADPCHLALSRDASRLYVSNYRSGSLTCYKLDDRGMPAGVFDHRQHAGSGPNLSRQERAHVHFALERDSRVYVCDLGTDTIFRYAVQCDGLKPEPDKSVRLPGGCGPRHLAVHPSGDRVMYCVAELANAVFMLEKGPEGVFEIVQVRSTLPEGCSADSTAAAIKMTGDGRYLMASNRGHDSIAVYEVRMDGRLEAPVISPCVAEPRDFLICGGYVLVGSQKNSEIRAYRFNRQTRELTDTGYGISAHRPTCFALCRG